MFIGDKLGTNMLFPYPSELAPRSTTKETMTENDTVDNGRWSGALNELTDNDNGSNLDSGKPELKLAINP